MAKGDFTKAKQIPIEVKKKVWELQGGKSIFPPYMQISVEECCCHLVSRGCSGLGNVYNIFGCKQTLGHNEHMLFDQHKKIANIEGKDLFTYVCNVKKRQIHNWSLDKCKYNKDKWKEKDGKTEDN